MAARGSNAFALDPAEPGPGVPGLGESKAGRTARFRHQTRALAEHRLRLGRLKAKIHEHVAAALDAACVVPTGIVLLHGKQGSNTGDRTCEGSRGTAA